ncbi:UNVERIFIED_CONTAM: hypothetical protein NCL1_15079 [Trichonephila clavipes]
MSSVRELLNTTLIEISTKHHEGHFVTGSCPLAGQQQQLRAFASAFGHRPPPYLDPRYHDFRDWRKPEHWTIDLQRRMGHPQDSLYFGDGHWSHPYSPYFASASGLQGPGIPSYQLDVTLAGVSPSSQDSCSSSLPLTGLADHATGVTSTSSSFPVLNDTSGALSLKTDPLVVSRYNAMAAVAANPELRLTDRLTELRQGLSNGPQQPNTTVSLLSGTNASSPYLSAS